MSLKYDLYIERDTMIHRLDPRVKLIGAGLGMIAAVAVSNLLVLAVIYAIVLIVIKLGQVTWERFKFAFRTILPVSIMIICLWPLFYRTGTPVLFSWGPIVITLPSILAGISSALRINVMAFCAFALLYTTAQGSLVRGLVRLGLPYEYGLSLAIALRYIPTFGGIILMIMDAQKARGLELDKGNFMRKILKYVYVMAPVVITALRMADQLSLAIESRAFGAPTKRTYVIDLKMRAADGLALGAVAVAFGALMFARLLYGFGA
ncbi:MAG: energy-coupling factor transporter transmembrane component T [Candidatus Bathyarchaeia archaeon]